MRDFNKVSPRVWQSKKVRGLGAKAKLVYLYLLTSPHCNSLGCYTLPIPYADADLNIDAREALAECQAAGLIEFDDQENVVLVKQFISFNPPTNIKHAMKMVADAKNIHVPDYRRQILEEIQSECMAKDWDGVDTLFGKDAKAIDTLSIHKTRPDQTRLPQDKTAKAGLSPSASGKGGWVELNIGEDALNRAKKNAPGWDIRHLMRVYEKWLTDENMERPDNLDRAFPVWVLNFTKGKRAS